MSMERRPPASVLFACDNNTVRSVLAVGLAKARYGDQLYFDSAGVRAGDEPDPFAVAVLAELGIDMSKHVPKSFQDLHDTSFDWIISLSPSAQHRAVELTRTMACDLIFWPTFDVTAARGSRESIVAAYREARDALARRIDEAFAPLVRPRNGALQERS
ncbi:MAG: low molecular weight phosphatase family protein [Alphaproteobacteria bacterium]|nr:low molecular weight phosphatase family protein [Alphaproteobacteria bacterium]